MNKFFVILLFTILALNCTAQIFDGYKYVKVYPLCIYKGPVDNWEFSNSSEDGVKTFFEQLFKDKGFRILSNHMLDWPEEVVKHPELMLWCFTYMNSDINLRISNFNGKLLLENNDSPAEGTGSERFHKALEHCKEVIDSYSYRYDSSQRIELVLPEVEQTGETETSFLKYLDQSGTDKIEGIYVSNVSPFVPHYKLGIKKYGHQYKVIVLESQFDFWKEGELKALIKDERPDGSYQANWYSLNKNSCVTHIYLTDHDELRVRKPKCSINSVRESTFMKIYPISD